MSDQNETEAQNAEEARKRRREELMATLASKTEAQNSDEATKRRREELMATLAANPRFKIRSGTGEAFIMPGGMPPKPDRA